MDIGFFTKYYSYFLSGTLTTLTISLFGVVFGTVIGVFLALMKLSKNKILKTIASIYIEVVRGTPLILQIYLVYYGFPRVFGFLQSFDRTNIFWYKGHNSSNRRF